MDNLLRITGLLICASSVVGELRECQADTMEAILGRSFEGRDGCRPRLIVVELPTQEHQYESVSPSHVEVMRCGGSCSHTFHNCIPDQTSVLTVPVLLSRRFSVAGPADTLCASVPVEQHESCGCGCDLGPTACNKRQFFLPTECRCTCSDSAARDACLARSWFWHPQLCQCMCPNRPYAPCPTGYIFDHVETCACRTLAYRAFSVLELVVVVVALGTLCTTLSLIQCYRKGLGLFKHRREIRYRTESFRSRLKSLSERLDRSRRRTGGVDVTVAAVAAVSAASGEQEEFIQLRSLSPQDSSNSSPKRLPGVLQLTDAETSL